MPERLPQRLDACLFLVHDDTDLIRLPPDLSETILEELLGRVHQPRVVRISAHILTASDDLQIVIDPVRMDNAGTL